MDVIKNPPQIGAVVQHCRSLQEEGWRTSVSASACPCSARAPARSCASGVVLTGVGTSPARSLPKAPELGTGQGHKAALTLFYLQLKFNVTENLEKVFNF